MRNRLNQFWLSLVAAATLVPSAALAQEASTAEPVTLPYTEKWQTAEADIKAKLWTVWDANEDGKTWVGDGSLCYYNGLGALETADDWLVSPPLVLEAGKTYTVETAAGYANGGVQLLSMSFGTSDNPEEYTQFVPATTVDKQYGYGSLTPVAGTFTVTESGNYRVGLHAESKGAGMLALAYVKFYETASVPVSPAKVSNLKVEVGAKGAVSSKVSFTTPTTNANGAPISSLTKVQIYRDDAPDATYTISNPTVGTDYTWNDTGITEGLHKYAVVAVDANGRSAEARDTVYVGVDQPATPTNVRVVDNLDGTATMSWDPITEVGAHGGYVNTAGATYTVNRLYYGYLWEVTDGTNISGTSLVITGLSQTGAQTGEQYVVTANTNNAVDTLATSAYGRAEAYVYGAPYSLPYYESFPGASPQKGPWYLNAAENSRFALGQDSQDDDGGCVYLNLKQSGDKGSIKGPKVTVKGSANPKLSYYYYAMPHEDSQVYIYLDANGQGEEELVSFVDMNDYDGEAGWKLVSVDLKDYKNCEYFRPRIAAKSDVATVKVDNLRIYDAVDFNLEATISAPTLIQKGQSAQIKVHVSNLGEDSADDYTVDLYVNDNKVESQEGVNLDPSATHDYYFTYVPSLSDKSFTVYAKAAWDVDEAPDNNVTETKTVTVSGSDYPAVQNLTAVMNGDHATLNWDAYNTEGQKMTEGFEAYDSFTLDNFGLWSVYDEDECATYTFSGLSYPNMGEPKAYTIFNCDAVSGDMSDELWETFRSLYGAHNGKQWAASIGTRADQSRGTQDWLISPLLSGKAQTVTFWTFAPDDDGVYCPDENFEVYYSTTDTDIDSFEPLQKGIANATWQQTSVNLPEGTKYFAIYHSDATTLETSWLGIDDVTFVLGKYDVKGYKIFRDGQYLTTVDGNTTTWDDNDLDYHVYNVVAILDNAESAPSNDANTDPAGISSVSGNNLASAVGVKGAVNVYGAAGNFVQIYNAAGARIFAGTVKDNARIAAQSGLYVVKVGARTVKVVVK